MALLFSCLHSIFNRIRTQISGGGGEILYIFTYYAGSDVMRATICPDAGCEQMCNCHKRVALLCFRLQHEKCCHLSLTVQLSTCLSLPNQPPLPVHYSGCGIRSRDIKVTWPKGVFFFFFQSFTSQYTHLCCTLCTLIFNDIISIA